MIMLSNLRGVWYQHDGNLARLYRRLHLWLDSFRDRWICSRGSLGSTISRPDTARLFLVGPYKRRDVQQRPGDAGKLEVVDTGML